MGCPWTGIRRLFAIACSLTHGGITQLVECLLCKQNVAGSNPTTSTSYSRISSVLSFFDNWQLEIKENYNSYNEIKRF